MEQEVYFAISKYSNKEAFLKAVKSNVPDSLTLTELEILGDSRRYVAKSKRGYDFFHLGAVAVKFA